MNPGCVNFIVCWLRTVTCKLQGMQTWMEHVRFWFRLRFGPAPVIREDGVHVVFENAFIRLTISLPDGNTSAFHLKSTGEDFIAAAVPFAFYSDPARTRHEPDRASFVRSSGNEGNLHFFVDDGAIQISVGCKVYKTHLAFEVERVASTSSDLPADVERVCIVNMKFRGDDFSLMTGTVLSGAYRISQFALNLYTHIIVREPVRPSAPYSLEAWSLNAGQIHDIAWQDPWYASQVALFAGNKTEWLLLAREIEKAHDLPAPQIEGRRAKTHPDLNTSYLFVDVNPENVDEVIDYAKLGGFKYILARNWAKSYGHYELEEVFASGGLSAWDGMRQVSKRVHAAGLKFGLHVLAGVVSENDEYFTTRQDALARKVHDPTDFLLFHNRYLPDIAREAGRALLHDMAHNFACLYYLTGANMAYLDTVDGAGQVFLEHTGDRMAWHAYSFLADAYWRALPDDANALFQAAGGNQNYEWHVLARQASTDYAAIGVEAYMDHFKIKTFREKLEKAPLAQELGWIGLLAKTGHIVEYSFASTTLEHIEYQLNRSAGHGLPIGLETTVDELRSNALTGQILERIELYERLRLRGDFPCKLDDAIREKLKSPGLVTDPDSDANFIDRYSLTKVDYLLVQNDSGRCGFQRRAYIEYLVNGAHDTWQFENPFGLQPLKIKITALPALAPFADYIDEPPNIPLIIPTDVDHLECAVHPDDPRSDRDLVCTLSHSADMLELSIENQTGRHVDKGWVRLAKKLPGKIDLCNHKAIGLEIASTNPEVVVSIILSDSREQRRQYQIKFSSTEIQYHQILLPATYSVFDYTDNIPQEYQKTSLRPFRYDQVESVSIWVKNINLAVPPPPEHPEPIVIRIKSVMALQQTYPHLENPSVTLNGGRPLRFEGVTLSPTDNPADQYGYWDYLVFNGDTYTVYDGNNRADPALGAVPVNPGDVPFVKEEGNENTITYKHTGEDKAIVTIVVEDSPQFRC